jgi:pimeloyl-ACP methyl ester carboxylesterase
VPAGRRSAWAVLPKRATRPARTGESRETTHAIPPKRDTRGAETGDSPRTNARLAGHERTTRRTGTQDSRSRAERGAAPRVLVCLVLCAAAVLAGCTVGPSQRPPVAVRGENMPALPSPAPPTPTPPPLPEPDRANSTLDFRGCTGGRAGTAVPTPPDRALRVECAQLTVEADPGQPGLGRTRLGLLRVGLADAPADRPPLLVVGDSTTDPSAVRALRLAGQVPLALLQRYTLVGLDRRGAGIDDLHCGPALARNAFVNIDPGGDGDVTRLNALLEQARSVVQDCYLVHAGALSGYRTASTAADVEQVRSGLGVAHLSALGVGDGAAALTMWARAHPEAVARLVLDAPPNPTLDEPDAAEARAAAAETAFDAFAAACTSGPDCPLGADPRAVVASFVDRLRAQPLTSVNGRRLTAGMTVTVLLAGLGEPAGWPDLATAIGTAQGGDPSLVLDRLTALVVDGGGFDVALATACNDVQRRMTPTEISELTSRWRVPYRLFGPTMAQRLLACGPWPTTVRTAPPDPGSALPPVLVIGTAHDPRGPLEGSRTLAGAIRGALFLSWQGAGTGAYPRTPCVTAAVDSLLVDGAPPVDGTLCPP